MVSSSITVYGTAWCGDCRRAKKTLDGRGASHTWVDIDAVPEAAAEVVRLNGGMRSVPTIVFPDGSILVEPSDRQLAARIDEFPEIRSDVTVASTDVSERGRWNGKSILAGLIASILRHCLAATPMLGEAIIFVSGKGNERGGVYFIDHETHFNDMADSFEGLHE